MKDELQSKFEREADWQSKRADIPWEVKLRQALILRETTLKLKKTEGCVRRDSHDD